MPNRKFRVILSTQPSVRIGGDIHLEELGESEHKTNVLIRELKHPQTGVPMGFLIAITLAGSDIENVLEKARTYAESLVSIISYLTNVGIPPVRVERCWEFTPGKHTGEYVQFIYDLPIELTSVRDLDRLRFLHVLRKLQDSDDSSRIARAIRWYRNGIIIRDIIDRFTSFWFGLEAVDPLLQILDSGEGKETDEAAEAAKETPLVGVKTLLGENWQPIRNLRVKTVHAFESLERVTASAKDLTPHVDLALIHALNKLLGIEETKRFPSVSLTSELPIYQRIDASISGPDLCVLDLIDEPWLEVTHRTESVTSNNRKTTKYQLTSNYKPRIPKGFQFEDIRVSTIGEPDIISDARVTGYEKLTDD